MAKQLIEGHIIQKQFIEISFEDISDAFALQNYVSEVFQERILPQMVLLFDEFADEQHLISFEELRINCALLSREHWEEEWVEETIRGLRKELLAANKIHIQENSLKRKLQEEFLFFLKHGYLPWNTRILSIQEFSELEFDSQLIEQLKALIQSEEKTAERLVYTFSDEFLSVVINSLGASQEGVADKFNSLIANPSRQKRSIQLANLIQILCIENPSNFSFMLGEVTNKAKFNGKTRVIKGTDKHEKTKNGLESIYVNNAGLIILHPYLQQLFEALDLISDKSWKDKSAQCTAVIILQYLVMASDEAPEFDLPLNKILCGLLPDEVLEVQEPLSIAIKNECDSLIEAVIQHWTALKNTGVVAFRATFLQRPGKLSIVNNGWLLQVEQQAVDVLLSRLPWGIGTIRLPWMDQIIYTEWC